MIGQGSLRSFKHWKFGLFVRGLGKVLPIGAEVVTEGGGHTFVGSLTSEPFSAVLSRPGMQRKGSWMWGMVFC